MRGGAPSASSGVVPRRPDCVCADRPPAANSNAAALAKIATRRRISYPLDLDGAFLEVGLQRDRVGGVERHLVDELRLVEPGHEHEAARRLVASAGLDAGADEAA